MNTAVRANPELHARHGRGGRDEPLVEALRRDDEGAPEELVACYGDRIYRLARRLLRNEADAEEITQDVLLTVVNKIGTFKGEAALSSWIYRITVNAAYARLRSRRSRTEVPLDSVLPVFDAEGNHVEPLTDWSGQLEDPAVASEVRTAIERGLARLPDEYRVVILLHDVEGFPNREVARALGLSVAAVKSRIHRARLFLRRELEHLFSPASR